MEVLFALVWSALVYAIYRGGVLIKAGYDAQAGGVFLYGVLTAAGASIGGLCVAALYGRRLSSSLWLSIYVVGSVIAGGAYVLLKEVRPSAKPPEHMTVEPEKISADKWR